MKKKNITKLFITFLLLCGVAGPAQAYVILDDWSMNLNAITDTYSVSLNNALDGMITDINQIAYNGIAWGRTDDSNNNGLPDVGEIGRTDGLLASRTYLDTAGTQQFWTDGDTFFELTFDFSLNSTQTLAATAITPGVYVHLEAGSPTGSALQADGILDMYIDITPDASQLTGLGYTDADSLKVASFAVKQGYGGTFLPATGDGSDDGTFELIWAIAGIFEAKDGTDLTATIGDPNAATIAITDSNFDADPNNNGLFDSTFGAGADKVFGTADDIFSPPTPQTSINFVANEDGSASLGYGVVPEPTTMLLFGFGLLGIAGIGRRKSDR